MENERAVITFAKYMRNLSGHNVSVQVTYNGVDKIVPLDPANTAYAEIMRQVEAGELTIEEAG